MVAGPSETGADTVVSVVSAEQAPLLARPYFRGEATSPLVATLAHVPEVLDVTLPFVAVVLGESAISLRLKELVILRTSVVQRCAYCVATHSVAALDCEIAVEQVRALRASRPPKVIAADGGEEALIEWVDAVAGTVGPVAREAAERLRAHFSAPEVVELTLLCAATVMLNRYCTALALPTGAATVRRLVAEGLA